MSTPVEAALAGAIGDFLAQRVTGAEPGHCVRVDDIDSDLAGSLAADLQSRLAGAWVHVLRQEPTSPTDIAPERAVELRNRKGRPLLLLVPYGEGGAASSLDNSFERVRMLDVFRSASTVLINGIADPEIRDAVRQISRVRSGPNHEAWAEFIAALTAEPTIAELGANLWRIGLIPDLGADPLSRLERNRLAVVAIARPSRSSASVDDRLTSAGMQEGAWRGPLRRFLEQQGASLVNPQAWAEQILYAHRELSFDKWKVVEFGGGDLESVSVVPFRKPDGSLDKVSKLALGGDGQLVLTVPEDGEAPLLVQWKTDPPKSDAVAKWRLEVVLPEDLRSADSVSLATAEVKGALRRCTLKVTADEDALAGGTQFVVVVTALGEFGETLQLPSGDPATADSQEFQVVLADAPEPKVQRRASASLPEAVVRAAVEGLDDLGEDLASWDIDGQVFSVRLGNRRAVQVRVNEQIVGIQRAVVENPQLARHWRATADYGTPTSTPDDAIEVEVPAALRKARAEFLSELGKSPQRNTGESADWTPELRELARTYVASYKRALDAADGEVLRGVMLLDSLSLRVRRSNRVVFAVVLLPIHPIRIGWIGTHDEVLRDWAERLTSVTPRMARKSQVGVDLVAQIAPANLPFAVLHADGEVAAYAEELTFGAGLYLVPGDLDSDAAAESVASVLGITRAAATVLASARMVAERIGAYQAAHDSGAALRLIAINPGSGELVAAALDSALDPDDDDEVTAGNAHRLEVVCYTDSASYVVPTPSLAELQKSMRSRESARESTHLAPPLSLKVLPSDQLLEDDVPAHLAVLQDIAEPVLGLGAASERKPSFRDLLVPLVTSQSESNGDVVWRSVPTTGPLAGGADHSLVSAHRSHQRALGRLLGGTDASSVPSVSVVLDGERRARINAAHSRSDWVIGLDRFVGVNLFETGLSEPYILDYAPDFIEGIGERLTVTTTHRSEVEALLHDAMLDLGLAEVDQSIGHILQQLAVVSGRLALRLLQNSTQAREAVSLAALVAHLQSRGELDDLIVVPVDAHPEIFGPAGQEEGSARRCDLLLVRVGQRSFKIECVEVKSRKEAKLPKALADMIVDQLHDTRRVLMSRFFADPPRIDGELQRARLVSLLHYYADRSANHGLIAQGRIAEVHRFIDRIEESAETAEISLRGYVISIGGDAGFKKKYDDVPLTVLTAVDLGKIGLTTRLALEFPEPESPEPEGPEPEGPEPEGPEPQGPEPDLPEPDLPEPDAPEDPLSNELHEPNAFEPGDSEDEASGDVQHSSGELRSSPATTSRSDVVVDLGQDKGGAAVRWHVSTKGSPHAFIIGIPGQGKSVTTRKIIRDFSTQGLPSLVFDFHGDMAAEPSSGTVVLDAAEGLPFNPLEPDVGQGRPINTTAWEIAEIVGYVGKLGEIQRNHVYKALQRVYSDAGWHGVGSGERVPTLTEFGDALEDVETGAAGRNARARLQPLTDFGLFRDESDGNFEILSADGQGWIVDVSKLSLEEVQRFAASFILRRIYRQMFGWPQDGTMKLAVVLDEAHRMARDVTLPKIMKEGRKYGVSVIVASQSIDDFHKDVVGNAGTKIVFRTNYPASKAVGGLLRGRGGIDPSQEIEKLGLGVAMISTPSSPEARKVYMTP